MSDFERARTLLQEFKGSKYLFGPGVLRETGKIAIKIGKKGAIVHDIFPGSEKFIKVVKDSMSKSGMADTREIKGAKPNCPREDLFRITDELKEINPEVIISFGGGSTIDAVKAAEVLRTLNGNIDAYFGTGVVTKVLEEKNKSLTPHIAVQTAASSASHLTKYSNITDTSTGQKKLIVDQAIIPEFSVFDYEVTYDAPQDLTIDGALDGIAHSLEVLYGAVGKNYYDKIQEVAALCISLAVQYLPRVMDNRHDREVREALCLATDLGGYAIMTGGTNGGHLTSFSLVDILSHGRACAIMNPYYTVFFAPAILEPLKLISRIYKKAGYTDADIGSLSGRELGIVTAEAMIRFQKRINFPTTLGEVPGFSDTHIERAVKAAKNPQLKMKLENMPVPLAPEMIDEYMKPVLLAAKGGDLSIIKNV